MCAEMSDSRTNDSYELFLMIQVNKRFTKQPRNHFKSDTRELLPSSYRIPSLNQDICRLCPIQNEPGIVTGYVILCTSGSRNFFLQSRLLEFVFYKYIGVFFLA